MKNSRDVLIVAIILWAVFMVCVLAYKLDITSSEDAQGSPQPKQLTVQADTSVLGTSVINDYTALKCNPVYFELSDYERKVAECIVMGEAGGESYEGQMLVAQCLVNACAKDGLQPSEVREKYQYSGWNDEPSDSVKSAVSAVFDDGEMVVEEMILYFYAPKWCTSTWHESQEFVLEHGGHRFFAERE